MQQPTPNPEIEYSPTRHHVLFVRILSVLAVITGIYNIELQFHGSTSGVIVFLLSLGMAGFWWFLWTQSFKKAIQIWFASEVHRLSIRDSILYYSISFAYPSFIPNRLRIGEINLQRETAHLYAEQSASELLIFLNSIAEPAALGGGDKIQIATGANASKISNWLESNGISVLVTA